MGLRILRIFLDLSIFRIAVGMFIGWILRTEELEFAGVSEYNGGQRRH